MIPNLWHSLFPIKYECYSFYPRGSQFSCDPTILSCVKTESFLSSNHSYVQLNQLYVQCIVIFCAHLTSMYLIQIYSHTPLYTCVFRSTYDTMPTFMTHDIISLIATCPPAVYLPLWTECHLYHHIDIYPCKKYQMKIPLRLLDLSRIYSETYDVRMFALNIGGAKATR